MAENMVIRLQSPDQGTKRIQTRPGERLSDFLDKVQKEFGFGDRGWCVYMNRDKSNELRHSRSKTLSSYKIKHGDMMFVHATASSRPPGVEHNTASNSSQISIPQQVVVNEDEVDQYMEKQDGRIQRTRSEHSCRHGPSGKCFHCVPLEPFDETYLNSVDPPIKFLSFHSYIRKLTSGADKGKFVNMENLSCKIKSGCKEHPPWPGGICTKCQPNAVTLNRQKYRHIDYVQFENPFLMDRFLNYWRNTGNQRLGILYGTYQPYTEVPLGIKAVVAAIYEPPQVSTRNSVQLLEDEKAGLADELASKLGLRQVGWIFTDLVAQDLQAGTVKHFRGNINSHFLSAEECVMAADYQVKHPNPCKLSGEGHFGSKFATVVVTGNSKSQINFEAYQVSDQCMALVRDECLIPTVDAPELAYVKESSNQQYVPDVFYKEKDEYGNEVTQMARPLPVEYLLVDFPAAFPVEPQTSFSIISEKPFPVENRADVGELQDFNAFSSYLQQFSGGDRFLEAVSDFHLLLYMANCDMLPVKDTLDSLLAAVKSHDEELAHHWRKTEEWATVEQLLQAHMPSPPTSRQQSYDEPSFVGRHASPLPPIAGASAASVAGAPTAAWTCKHCTFINQSGEPNCDMCGLPPT